MQLPTLTEIFRIAYHQPSTTKYRSQGGGLEPGLLEGVGMERVFVLFFAPRRDTGPRLSFLWAPISDKVPPRLSFDRLGGRISTVCIRPQNRFVLLVEWLAGQSQLEGGGQEAGALEGPIPSLHAASFTLFWTAGDWRITESDGVWWLGRSQVECHELRSSRKSRELKRTKAEFPWYFFQINDYRD